MSITSIYDGELRVFVSIQTKGSDKKLIDNLNEALTVLFDKPENSDFFYKSIDITGQWSPHDGEFDAWGTTAARAWLDVATRPSIRNELKLWATKVEKIFIQHGEIWDSEEALFGEVPISYFGLLHLEFVPLYSRFIDSWGLNYMNDPERIIAQMAENHGCCPEIEDMLLKCVVDQAGGGCLSGFDLKPVLQNLYGDFPKSKLFRRIIHAKFHKGGIGPNYHPNWPELAAAEKDILATLDTA